MRSQIDVSPRELNLAPITPGLAHPRMLPCVPVLGTGPHYIMQLLCIRGFLMRRLSGIGPPYPSSTFDWLLIYTELARVLVTVIYTHTKIRPLISTKTCSSMRKMPLVREYLLDNKTEAATSQRCIRLLLCRKGIISNLNLFVIRTGSRQTYTSCSNVNDVLFLHLNQPFPISKESTRNFQIGLLAGSFNKPSVNISI